MCEFCLKHGEGQKWYLQASNYSDDLLSDAHRRRLVKNMLSGTAKLREGMQALEKLDKLPRFLRGIVRGNVVRRMKKLHYGQVLPIEDVEKIFSFSNSIVRVACICRKATLDKDKRYCYGVSLTPGGGALAQLFSAQGSEWLTGPDAAGTEPLTKEQALAAFREHEHEGLCHTVWTFNTPFIGGICNCDRTDCLAMRCTVTHALPMMFRAEYIAQTDPDACTGCRNCMRACQFGAIGYSASNRKAVIDQRWCYGCGICRAACSCNAISLTDRSNIPAASQRW